MAKGDLLKEASQLTADAVARKQDAAKLNYPNLAERIKEAAATGASECIVPLSMMGEYDKKLLQDEGFSVSLQDVYHDPQDYKAQYFDKKRQKEWVIRW